LFGGAQVRAVSIERSCACLGTTNKDTYLKDETAGAGSGRQIRIIDIVALAADRDRSLPSRASLPGRKAVGIPTRRFEAQYIQAPAGCAV